MGTTTRSADEVPDAAPRRGRPRAPDRTGVILDAVVDLLQEIGYDRLRVQDVAERAGVGLATVYRRWPTKQELIIDALRRYAADTLPLHDTGDPRADLVTVVRQLGQAASERSPQAMGFVSALRSEPVIAEAYRDLVMEPLRAHLRKLVAAVIGPDHPELRLRGDVAPAVLVFRSLVTDDVIDADATARELVDLMLRPA